MSPFQRIETFGLDLLRRATAPVYRNVPLRAWPRAIGRIHEIAVPSRVRPYAEPTPTSPANINILLELLDAVRTIPGDVAECGVFQGSSLIALALHLRLSKTSKEIYGFDSFEGFGESISADFRFERTQIDPAMTAAGFSNTSVERVERKARFFGIKNVHLIKGYFETSLDRCPATTFSFAHLDCDTYQAYRECLHFFYPKLSPGAIVVFDEYNDAAWPGCNEAVDEFLSGKPEDLVDICRENYIKTYFVKR